MVLMREFIDYGFCPRLPGTISGDHLRFLESAKVPQFGTPAPILVLPEKHAKKERAAVWVGESPNTSGEVPTIAVVTRRGATDPTAKWFVGVVELERIEEEAAMVDSVAPKQALLLEYANHYIQSGTEDSTDIYLALNLLMRLHLR